jgi:hypothetical protein
MKAKTLGVAVALAVFSVTPPAHSQNFESSTGSFLYSNGVYSTLNGLLSPVAL